MADETEVTQEVAPEVVQPEAEQVEAPEVVESTEGQDQESQPAEDNAEAKAPEEAEDKPTPAQLRRERRKAQQEKINAELAAAKRDRDAAEAKLAKIEEATKKRLPPKEEDFDDYNQYIAATGAYHAHMAMTDSSRDEINDQATQAKQRYTEAEKLRAQEAAQTWAEQRAEAQERYSDFDSVVTEKTPIAPHTAELIVQSDVGADVAYHLGSNPKLAYAMAQMNPVEAAREFGKLEATLSAPKTRNKTNAPDPVNPVRPKASATTDPTKMSVDEYRAWRAAGGTF